LLLLDISTGEFLIAEGDESYIDKLIQSFAPSEIVFPKHQQKKFVGFMAINTTRLPLEDWVYQEDFLKEKLHTHFQVQTLKGFGIDELHVGILGSWCMFALSSRYRTQQTAAYCYYFKN
jgi:DNA mismatch repair protein MutS